MTSERQISANRLNARRSCGPRTVNGKKRSRQNAIKHGFAAETVIGVLENVEDYRIFENAIKADYHPQSTVECTLIARLASLLWRLRRVSAVEAGLLEIQARILQEREKPSGQAPDIPSIVMRIFSDRKQIESRACDRYDEPDGPQEKSPEIVGKCEGNIRATEIAKCFLRINNIHEDILDRISRYESVLWRQAKETLVAIDAVIVSRSPMRF
jgi:hypothetical protein